MPNVPQSMWPPKLASMNFHDHSWNDNEISDLYNPGTLAHLKEWPLVLAKTEVFPSICIKIPLPLVILIPFQPTLSKQLIAFAMKSSETKLVINSLADMVFVFLNKLNHLKALFRYPPTYLSLSAAWRIICYKSVTKQRWQFWLCFTWNIPEEICFQMSLW